MAETTGIPMRRLHQFVSDCLERVGASAEDANVVADVLVAANLRGVDSVPVKLIHTVESFLLPTADYLNLLQFDDLSKQKRGIEEVTRHRIAVSEPTDAHLRGYLLG